MTSPLHVSNVQVLQSLLQLLSAATSLVKLFGDVSALVSLPSASATMHIQASSGDMHDSCCHYHCPETSHVVARRSDSSMDTCLLGGAVPSLPSVTQQPVRSRGAQLLQPPAGLHSSGSRYRSGRGGRACSYRSGRGGRACSYRSGRGGRACTAAAAGSAAGPTQHAWRAPDARCTGRRRRGVVAAAAVATEQPPVAERLSGEDADQWAASLEEVGKQQ